MATDSNERKLCSQCNKGGATFTCDGCHQSFCLKHATDHREELAQQLDDIGQQYDILKRDIDEQSVDKTLLEQIDQWEESSIKKIRSHADQVRADLNRSTEESKTPLNTLMHKLSSEIQNSRQNDTFTEHDIIQWTTQLENLRQDFSTSFEIELVEKDGSYPLRLITIKNHDKTNDNNINSTLKNIGCTNENPSKPKMLTKSPEIDDSSTRRKISPNQIIPSISTAYLCVALDSDPPSTQTIQRLFQYLMSLHPMEKNGPMRGRCEPQADQMEQFLTDTFGFENIPGKFIIPGVKSFRLRRPPHALDPNISIYFPNASSDAFQMTTKEIVQWQRSYRVYTDRNLHSMTNDFLYRALQGKCEDNIEAFNMKYVVRISTCPILMEFDAKVIPRKLNEDWPHRIKLVSATGIDFAGRKHDVGDILHFVSNWRDIYEVDIITDTPALLNERDFCRKRTRPKGELDEARLLDSLTSMAKLRLQACDMEGVQIVVETGIGLGVFAGEQIGIADTVQITSALAIRAVLEQDGPTYKNIRAIVFALPVIGGDDNGRRKCNPFHDFVEQFQVPQYKGPIPVMIADQDMHRLAVAIARQGFVVSQLNPSNSHGLFGEYWQNRGPTVEEKLALTTLGLLVQHHLINREVLNLNNYNFI